MLKLFKRKADDPRAKLQAVLAEFELPTFPAVVISTLDNLRGDDVSLASVADLLPTAPARGFDAARFWATSARRAVTAKALADRIDPSASSESYTASLLQDMALPVLSHQKGEEYGEVLEQWHGGASDLPALESDRFGWDHAQVGQWMCEAWGFLEKLAEAIGAHHAPPRSAPLPAANLVALLREVDEAPGIEKLVECARDDFGIPPDETASVLESSVEAAVEISRMFV